MNRLKINLIYEIRHNWKERLKNIGTGVIIGLPLGIIIPIWGVEVGLIYVTIVIATIAARTAIRSMRLTRDSLELARATTRPFLTVTDFYLILEKQDEALIRITVCNTGIYPADNVFLDFNLFTKGQYVEENSLSGLTGEGLFFPSEKTAFTLPVVKDENVDLVKNSRTKLRVIMDYEYKLTRTKHKTFQEFRLVKVKDIPGKHFRLDLDKEKSYWY